MPFLFRNLQSLKHKEARAGGGRKENKKKKKKMFSVFKALGVLYVKGFCNLFFTFLIAAMVLILFCLFYSNVLNMFVSAIRGIWGI